MSLWFVYKDRGLVAMKLKGVIFEDFINYKKPSMVLEFPYCTFKCGKDICQNSQLAQEKIVEVSISGLVKKYKNNFIVEAVVCQGLEPLDSFDELIGFIDMFRKYSEDDIVIFTGYDEEEIEDKVNILQKFKNVIIKFGRYIPNQSDRYDDILGITLVSDNQYAKKIS